MQFIVDKVRKTLALWKSNYLSRADKLVFINSTPNSIPAYYLQYQTLPSATVVDLDRTCNDFLWGEKDSKKKIHLVGKDSTFLPKDQWGLGIRAHADLRTIYMARLGGEMSHGSENLSQEYIMSKYIKENRVTLFKN